MSKIELDGLTKRYGDLVAVDDVDASVPGGEYTMILGPSGSGKSTLLRMIAGLEAPTSGQVFIGGEDVTDRPARRRGLSMVFQNLALWDHKTVRDNIAFGLKMHGVGADERRERVQRTAELLQIADKLDATPDQLSGGQRQRVALGRSLVREPDVVLLDEPLSSLDQRLRLRMRTELRRIQQETGTTFVHVTHNQEDAMTVADRILLINEGRVEQFARPLELYHAPTNEFVGDFIGSPSMNLLAATFVDDGEPRFDAEGDLELDLPEESWDHFRERCPDGHVRLGVRPEAFRFVDGDAAVPIVEGTVSIVETFGDYAWYYVETPGGVELVVQSNDDDVMGSVAVGDDVRVTVAPEAIHTFDPGTGESLGTASYTVDEYAGNAAR